MKRTVKRNRYGSMKGYEGRSLAVEFNGGGIDPYSEAEAKAVAAWLGGRDDWRDAAWEE